MLLKAQNNSEYSLLIKYFFALEKNVEMALAKLPVHVTKAALNSRGGLLLLTPSEMEISRGYTDEMSDNLSPQLTNLRQIRGGTI